MTLATLLAQVDWMAAVGRLHPLVLHLPIGLLIALTVLELVYRRRGLTGDTPARGVLVGLLALTTPLAAVTGWLLHESDDYGSPVEWHEWLGIALMFFALAIGVAHLRRARSYAPLVFLACLLVFPTAHLGAELTHGSGYLLEAWRGSDRPVATATASAGKASADHFAAVEEFFATYCTRCHGESKRKGELALHDHAALLAGGDGGPVVVPGDASSSALLARLRLPLDDEDHMPPEGKPQPTPEELAALAAWIDGLDEAARLQTIPVLSGPAEVETPTQAPAAFEPPLPDRTLVAASVQALREELVHVSRVAADSPYLLVDFSAGTLAPGELGERLGVLTLVIADLDLSAQMLDDSDIEFVAQLPRLEHLDLRQLRIDAPIDAAPLSVSGSLRSLNLAGTPVAEGGALYLAAISTLERVSAWKTGIDVEKLAELRPDLAIRGASPAPDAPLEVEPEVAFERFVDPQSGPIPQAENRTCPITGKAVDPRYTILSEGRAIGFCCPNCPATFWERQADEQAPAEDR